MKERKNTSVYVTGLCPDITVEELESHFSKCGIIMEDAVTRQAKIKIYRTDQGHSKGDALVIYYREESVQLAIDILDGSWIRPNVQLSVEKANFKSDHHESAVDKELSRKAIARLKKKLEWS